jgi:hypothetical protein
VTLTPDTLRAYLRLPPGDDEYLAGVCTAVTEFVDRTPAGRVAPWSAGVEQAALMLAARYVRRRATPSGVESTADGAVYLPRRDGDVDQLLRIGAFLRPAVG